MSFCLAICRLSTFKRACFAMQKTTYWIVIKPHLFYVRLQDKDTIKVYRVT